MSGTNHCYLQHLVQPLLRAARRDHGLGIRDKQGKDLGLLELLWLHADNNPDFVPSRCLDRLEVRGLRHFFDMAYYEK